jgi:hypothetical protein
VSSLNLTLSMSFQNADSLQTRRDAELVRQMVAVGKKALGEEADDATFCFHMPPWNSIDHLHLHAIAAPKDKYNAKLNKPWLSKYNTSLWFCWSADYMIEWLMAKPLLAPTLPPPSN